MGSAVNQVVGINVLQQGRVHGWMTQGLNTGARAVDYSGWYQSSSPENHRGGTMKLRFHYAYVAPAFSSLRAGAVDRGGHGIVASLLVTEVTRAGFRHRETMMRWPPDDDRSRLFLAVFERP